MHGWCCPVRVKVAEFEVSLRGEWGVDGDDVAVGEQGRGVDEGDLDGARRACTCRGDDSHVEGLAGTLSASMCIRVAGRMPRMTCTAVAVQQR